MHIIVILKVIPQNRAHSVWCTVYDVTGVYGLNL